MLADVPHTRPISIFACSENAAVRTQLGIERSSYEGPVGILSVLGDAAERSAFRRMSIWASVPHYVHNAPSPKATLALIDKLEEIIDVVIPRGELVDRIGGVGERHRRARGRRRRHGGVHRAARAGARHRRLPEASGEAIAQEFEKYLRRGEDKPKADE